ncbi:MAG TPA: hypothetical protein VK465_12205 [Fibrobacteria bacterium]|nr:hypothetical protein [Fibrobacteria bacterium]
MGILVFSLVLTLAAGGFLLTVGLAQSTALQSRESRKLQLAAESVMHMAIRYMRDEARDVLKGNNPNPVDTMTAITFGYHDWSQLEDASVRTALGNPLIKAAYRKDAGSGVTVFAWAAFQGSPTMLQISWKVLDAAEGGPGGIRNLTLRDWKDTLLPRFP